MTLRGDSLEGPLLYSEGNREKEFVSLGKIYGPRGAVVARAAAPPQCLDPKREAASPAEESNLLKVNEPEGTKPRK